MILSYHPIFTGDKNLICAGREAAMDDLTAIQTADAVILPQGCPETLYKMARNHCKNVFPNLDTKFKYPGKTGQIHLFRETKAAHPNTDTFSSVNQFLNKQGELVRQPSFNFPFVFKFDWGGEGKSVSLIKTKTEFENIMHQAVTHEQNGRKGFLFQEYIPSHRSLRVVVVGQQFRSYWRVQKDEEQFQSNLAAGGTIDSKTDPDIQASGVSAARELCENTGINLAGFDFLFSSKKDSDIPLFLEINYFFGRQGLGGSEKYYALLVSEIKNWLKGLSL